MHSCVSFIVLVIDRSVKRMLVAVLPRKGLYVFVFLLWGVAPEHMFVYSNVFPGRDPDDCVFVLVLLLGVALMYI